MPTPTGDQHKSNTQQIDKRYNVPNCYIVINGKDVRTVKEYYSLVLLVAMLAVSLSLINLGAYGSKGDVGVYSKSNFG